MKVALVIPVFNRISYLRQCLDSLQKLTYFPDTIILANDGSTDKDIPAELKRFADATGIAKIIDSTINSGVQRTLHLAIESAISSGHEMIINLDSDAIVKPHFISELLRLYEIGQGKQIVSGFNTHHSYNPVLAQLDGYCIKNYANGINMCFGKELFYKYIKPSFQKSINWDNMTSMIGQADNHKFIISTPSLVQHIGTVSSMGHNDHVDFAQDFKQMSLPNVTLLGINSAHTGNINRAADISQKDIEFGAVNIINETNIPGGYNENWAKMHSRFMIRDLVHNFKTSHVLTIRPDGYVLNWRKWDQTWLDYDYIGATWSYKDNMNVGNGGFSLRSHKLCAAVSELNIPDELIHPDDHTICRTYRRILENDFDIKFAPEEVANNFSIEAYGTSSFQGANQYSGQFGFRGLSVDFSHSEIPANILPAR